MEYIPNLINKGQLIACNKYELQLREDFYTLLLELYKNVLCFKLSPNNVSLNCYIKEYRYKDILKILSLQKTNCEDLYEIFIFFDKEIKDKKINLSENKNKKIMILKLKKFSDYQEFECNIELDKSKLPNEEIIKLLIDEINLLKKDKKESKELINMLIEKNKQNEERIKNLENKIGKYEELENSIIKKVNTKIEKFFLNSTTNLNQQHSFPPVSNPISNLGMMNNMNNINNNMTPVQKNEIIIILEDLKRNTKISLLCSPTEKIDDIRNRYFSKIRETDDGEFLNLMNKN